METKTSVMYAYPPQPTAIPVPQTQVVEVRQSANGVEKSIGLGVAEIILRVICLIFCLGASVAAIIAITAINDIEDYGGLQHADSYRGAAGWLAFVGILAVIFHGIMILIRILYLAANYGRTFSGYSFTNAVLCVVFGLALLSAGIVNAKYAADNVDLYDRSFLCTYFGDAQVCEDLQELYAAQAAAASAAFISMIFFIPLFIIALVSGIQKTRQASTYQGSTSAPYVQLPNNVY